MKIYILANEEARGTDAIWGVYTDKAEAEKAKEEGNVNADIFHIKEADIFQNIELEIEVVDGVVQKLSFTKPDNATVENHSNEKQEHKPTRTAQELCYEMSVEGWVWYFGDENDVYHNHQACTDITGDWKGRQEVKGKISGYSFVSDCGDISAKLVNGYRGMDIPACAVQALDGAMVLTKVRK